MQEKDAPANILFVIMDDVGIDQMKVFGYAGLTPPSTPNIDRIAQQGILFRNAWAMPACTTPLQQPPLGDQLAGNAAATNLDCSQLPAQRELSNLMVASIDKEIGRLLTETHLARGKKTGALKYRPERIDTMVGILGDNGSLGTAVKSPFSTSRAKGTAYQTGVWVPLVVSGPLVAQPDRSVPHMVNVADLYSLFGEIAGSEDVTAGLPGPVDAEPLLPYVVDPSQASIRSRNYAEVGPNLQAGGAINGPCTISDSCTQIPVSKGVCEDNNGTWWGEGHDAAMTANAPAEGFNFCCEVNEFVIEQGCYDELSAQLDLLLASKPSCPGDGNIDLVVNDRDLDGWNLYAQPIGTGLSSVFDFDLDGGTDEDD